MTKKTRTAGGVVLNKDGKVLVVNQKGTSWSLPKGHLDPGEDALTAAKREIYEESGISELNLQKELGTYSRYRIGLKGDNDTSEEKTITLYLFTTEQMDLAPVDGDNPEARWVERDEVSDLLTHEKDKQFYESIKNEFSHI